MSSITTKTSPGSSGGLAADAPSGSASPNHDKGMAAILAVLDPTAKFTFQFFDHGDDPCAEMWAKVHTRGIRVRS